MHMRCHALIYIHGIHAMINTGHIMMYVLVVYKPASLDTPNYKPKVYSFTFATHIFMHATYPNLSIKIYLCIIKDPNVNTYIDKLHF